MPTSSAHVRARARCTSTPTTLISCASWIPSERTRTRRSASSRWALGVVIPDITFELAKQKAQMASCSSPYDVERVYGKPFADISVTEHYDEMVADDRIKKTYIDARKFFTTIAELQFESGYQYIVFEDTVNRANPIEGRVTMSNLCSEILQVQEPSAYNEGPHVCACRPRHLLQSGSPQHR